MATEEYKIKYFDALKKYEELYAISLPVRKKLEATSETHVPVELTDDDFELLQAASLAWDEFLGIAAAAE